MNTKRTFLFLLFAMFSCFGLMAQNCGENEVELTISIIPDDYPQETSWTLTSASGDLITNGTIEGETVCISSESCVVFTITDQVGDGICCGYGLGSYSLALDGAIIAEGGDFSYSASHQIACQEGQTCDSAFAVEEGSHTAENTEIWYRFTPTETGQYSLTACGNDCNTAMWVYDYCAGLDWQNNQEAAIYYSIKGCGTAGEGATLNTIFEGGEIYWIRIGDLDGDCGMAAINWELSFLGAISGCTDPDACTFNPLATISDPTECFYYPSENCSTDLPDLIVLEEDIINTLQISTRNNDNDCFIEEGCFSGYGSRQILEFATHIENIGTADYYIGEVPSNPDESNNQFEFDPCHGHWHYEGYAEYILFDEEGQAIPIGFKNGFCVMDLDCSMNGGNPKFGCGTQGISAGCGDIYWVGLDCQWIDITDVEEGFYSLVVRVNWDQTPDVLGRPEVTYSNNWAQVCFDLTRDASGYPSIELTEPCEAYTDCTGELYGDAQIDCNGICNGGTLTGDLDANSLYEDNDALLYMADILNSELTISSCNDLDDSGYISIYDAALMLDCSHQQAEGNIGGNDKCEFPRGIYNEQDSVALRIGAIDFTNNTVDIEMKNPDAHIVAYQFEMSGLTISNTENLAVTDDLVMQTEANAAGIVIGLGINYLPIQKQTDFTPFIRLHFSDMDSEICIAAIHEVVNIGFETIFVSIDTEGQCLATNVGIGDKNEQSAISLYPNPFAGETTLYIDQSKTTAFQLVISDISGRTVRTINNITDKSVVIEQNNLTTGVYFYQLIGENANYSGKMVIK
ncbi:MAG: lysyl oxidase family protein [Chitinophagales bacterium]